MSTEFTAATLIQMIQDLIVALTAVNTAEAGARAALVDFEAEDAKTSPVIGALRRTLGTMYSNSPDTLAVFALKARKVPTPRTAAQKAATAAKAKATREARGTASKKSKAAITGNVTGVIITPLIAPASQPAQPVSTQPASPPAAAAPVPAQPATPAPPATPTGHSGQ
jgi:hypothetical protein